MDTRFIYTIIWLSLLALLLVLLFSFYKNAYILGDSLNPKPDEPISTNASLLGTFFYAWYGGKNEGYYGWNISNHHPPLTWGSHYIPNINSFKFDPSKELYSSNDTAVIKNQLTLFKRAGIQFGITDWYKIGHFEDKVFSKVIKEIMPSKNNPYPNFKWTLLYEREGYKNLTARDIITDLNYIKSEYTSSPYYLKIDGRPVIFVYNTGHKGHTLARDAAKWSLVRNETGFYVVMKDNPFKYKVDPTIVDGWYDYDPTKRYEQIGNYSASISPGAWKFNQPTLLIRNTTDFEKAAQKLELAKVHFKLIETWNEWYEGTSIEPGQQIIQDDVHGFRPAASSYGNAYVDALAKEFAKPFTHSMDNVFANNLLTYVTTYGINSTTGNVFAFVNAHGITITKTFNATKLDMMDNKTDGIALTSFVFQNLALKPGEPFTTCAVVINSAKMVCVTDYKTPFPRAQYVDIPLS